MPALRYLLLAATIATASAQTTQPKTPTATTSTTNPSPAARETLAPAPAVPTRRDILLGANGPFRANNDLLYYHLDIRVDPVAKTIAGKNTVRFKMLSNGTRIQLDLSELLQVDKIVLGTESLHYTRDSGSLFIESPRPLLAGKTYDLDVFYHGAPKAKGRFGGMSFELDPAGRPWIFTADEDDGCSIWWPCKDQWRDEPQDGMDISLAVPNALTGVSNGRLISQVDLKDGYTQWNWKVTYPINSYGVALNIGAYTHFSDTYVSKQFPPLSLDYYALPEDLDKAKTQFAQAKGMLEAFEHYFGEYPFARDGYKLVQVPYAGMEHQSAVAYGNGFDNGYLHRDWTGVGISPRFDFIIIHESGHEWFGNAVSAADRSDMWIHEAGTPTSKPSSSNTTTARPTRSSTPQASSPRCTTARPSSPSAASIWTRPQDMYFKGGLMIASLRSWLDAAGIADDKKWFTLIYNFYNHFKYQNIMTEDVIAWWNEQTHLNLTPLLQPVPAPHRDSLPRTKLQPRDEDRPLQMAGRRDRLQHAHPGGRPHPLADDPPHTTWQVLETPLSPADFQVATDLYFIHVSKT